MTELRPFQFEGVRAIYDFKGRALLGDEMGLGKTIQALYWVKKIPNRRPVVILAPASVKYTWQSEASQHFGIRTWVLEGKRKKRVMDLPGDIVILNYDILKSWLPALLKARPQCIVLDEVEYIKNLSADRTRAVLKLTENASSVLGLSGTPLVNRPIELWSVLQAINPEIFPSREKYAWKFCKPRWTRYGWQYDGACNMKELHRILKKRVMIRRLKKDVLKELPDKTRKAVPFQLSASAMQEYLHAKNNFLSWLGEQSPLKAKRAKRAEAVTKIGYLIRLVAKLKLEWTARWIEEFFTAHPNQKLVALTMHTFVIRRLKERFGDKAVVIDGTVIGKFREESKRLFQSNRRVNLLLGNWKAASRGLTLTAAWNLAALDLPWTSGDLLQGEDRVHRIGQKMKCVIHYLMALGTIEASQIKILRKKSEILDAILNGEGSPEDLNIFDELLAEMKRR